jgi:drug/metabolite transporter (DMT)-like permease
MKPHRLGIALCALSACGFGAMAVFAKEAYGEGVGVLTLLPVRFGLAAALFWVIVLARGARLPSRRALLTGLALGAGGYAAQAGLYFGALTRIDASLTALLLYIYPVLVFAGALALRREHVSVVRIGALVLACGGTALVLATGGALGAVDGLGLAMALAAAVFYAAYILIADRLVAEVDPFVLAALLCTGAAGSLLATGVGAGSFDLGFAAGGWGWIALLAFGSTVLGITCLLAGLRLVGPATASIVSTIEPAVTVGLAVAVYAEPLGPGRLLGGALVLAAVVLLQRREGTVAGDDPASVAARPAPARALAHEPARG